MFIGYVSSTIGTRFGGADKPGFWISSHMSARPNRAYREGFGRTAIKIRLLTEFRAIVLALNQC